MVLSANKRVTVAISVTLRNDHDQVNQIPNSKATKSQQLGHADAGFFRVEAMDAEGAQKEAEEEGCQPVISLYAVDDGIEWAIRGRLISGRRSAVGAESRARRDVSATVRAIHSSWFWLQG